MPRRRPKRPSPVAQSLAFWTVVLVISGVVAVISFRVGRDWLGKRVGAVEMNPGAPRIIAEGGDTSATTQSDSETPAPKAAQVSIEDREPSEAEKRRIEREQIESEPQDGAQLHTMDSADDAGPETEQTGAEQAPTLGEGQAQTFTVTAGAFADAENATKTVARLAAQGYTPYTETITREGRTLHRVNVAVVSGRAKAEQLRDVLAGDGVDAAIIAGN